MGEEPRGTEQTHRFRKPGKARVRIAVLDLEHKPVSGVAYSFLVGEECVVDAKTDGNGIAEMPVPERVGSVRLVLPWGEFPVEIGELDPANTVRGIQQRLTNLGIPCGPIDGLYGPLTRGGILSFQKIEGLESTGEPDADLIGAIRDRHDGQSIAAAEMLEEHAPEQGAPASEDSGTDTDDDLALYPDSEAFYGNDELQVTEDDHG